MGVSCGVDPTRVEVLLVYRGYSEITIVSGSPLKKLIPVGNIPLYI